MVYFRRGSNIHQIYDVLISYQINIIIINLSETGTLQ